MLDIFGGKRVHELTLEDVRALLDDAQAEPLHWEAKGVKISPGEVRKQISGFANTHDGGYLILGADVRDGRWVLEGATFPNNEAPTWVSSLAEGVRPFPEGLDTRGLRVSGPLEM